MTELFPNITEEQREAARIIADLALSQKDPLKVVKIINNYMSALDGEQYDFADFYFSMRMELLKDE